MQNNLRTLYLNIIQVDNFERDPSAWRINNTILSILLHSPNI